MSPFYFFIDCGNYETFRLIPADVAAVLAISLDPLSTTKFIRSLFSFYQSFLYLIRCFPCHLKNFLSHCSHYSITLQSCTGCKIYKLCAGFLRKTSIGLLSCTRYNKAIKNRTREEKTSSGQGVSNLSGQNFFLKGEIKKPFHRPSKIPYQICTPRLQNVLLFDYLLDYLILLRHLKPAKIRHFQLSRGVSVPSRRIVFPNVPYTPHLIRPSRRFCVGKLPPDRTFLP